jgi:hypothetical protein
MNKKSEENLIDSDDSFDFDDIEAPELESISSKPVLEETPPPVTLTEQNTSKTTKKIITNDNKPKTKTKSKKKSNNIFKRMAQGLTKETTKKPKSKGGPKPKKDGTQLNKMVDEIKNNLGGMDLSKDSNFLQKIQKNEILRKGFSNVKIMEQIGLISKNPKMANEFSKDPQFKEFFGEYMKLLGNTFEQKGKQEQPRQVPQPTFTIQKTGNPRIDAILEDPEVRKVLEMMSRGHRVEMYSLARQNPQLVEKMKVLMHSGYLQAQAQ